MIKITIVFAIFNGLNYTKKCLESLFRSIDIEVKDVVFSIVIVDDGSSDNSYEWIKDNYPSVNLIRGSGNLWWSGGINMAVKFAIKDLGSDYIVWWNNDIEVDDDYFRNLTVILKHNSVNTIVGSKIYYADQRNKIWSMGGFFNPQTGYKNMIGTKMIDNNSFQKSFEVDWLPGMGTVTHYSIYDKIGMLDENKFPQYHGDSDFTYRAKLHGYKIIVYPSLKIYNDVSNSALKHNDSFKGLINSLLTIKSNYNLKKDILFYLRYAKSYKAYYPLFRKYYRYIGGFIKWQTLRIFRMKK